MKLTILRSAAVLGTVGFATSFGSLWRQEQTDSDLLLKTS